MNYHITCEPNSPAYFQLYMQIKTDIVDLVYKYGTKLPSKRTLAAETGTSLITVTHALTLLEDEGYIEARQRSGYFVIYKQSDFTESATVWPHPASSHAAFSRTNASRTATYKGAGKETISIDLISKTMRKIIAEKPEQLLEKSPNFGLLELREEICGYLARSRGIHVDTSRIIIGSGAEYLYSLIAGMFEDAKTFAIEDPSYEKIGMVYRTGGKTVLTLPLDQNGIPSNVLRTLRADLLHVTPFHSYPSGVTANVSKKLEYLDWAAKNDAFLVEDNYDSELTVSSKPEDTLFSMDHRGCVIYMNTFSKTIASSMRVGYMILPEGLMDVFNRKFGNYSCTVPIFEQLVIAELIRSGNFERHINKIRRSRRKHLQRKG